MIHQRPVLETIGNHYVRNAAVVVYLASAILPPFQTPFLREYRQPSAILRTAEEIARPKLDEQYLASQLRFDIFRTQLLAVLRSTFHALHPCRTEWAMPSSVADFANTTIVNHKLFTIAYRQSYMPKPMLLEQLPCTPIWADPRSSCPRWSGFR